MDEWDRAVDKIIREAMEAGKFDNLPGRGRPLDLEENPFEDPTTRAAHRLLRSNGFSLPWIEERREIEAELDLARTHLVQSWRWYRDTLDGRVWEQAVSVFREKVATLNRCIRDFNLKVPSVHFHRSSIDADQEIEILTQESKGRRSIPGSE